MTRPQRNRIRATAGDDRVDSGRRCRAGDHVGADRPFRRLLPVVEPVIVSPVLVRVLKLASPPNITNPPDAWASIVNAFVE